MIQFFLLFCSLWKFLANIFAEILASFWTFFYLLDFREHYDNIVSGQHLPTPVWVYIFDLSLPLHFYALSQTLSFSVQITTQSFILFHKHFSEHLGLQECNKLWVNILWTFPPKHVRPPYFFEFLFYFISFVQISEHFRRDFSKFLDFSIRFSRTLRQYCVYIYI